MKIFTLKVLSGKHLYILLALSFPLFWLASSIRPWKVPLMNQLWFWFSGLGLFLLFLWALQQLGTAVTLWQIDDSCIRIRWKTQFAFSKMKDISLPLTSVQDVSFTVYRSYTRIKIKVRGRSAIRFYCDRLNRDDDFKLLKDFLYSIK